MTGVYLGDAAGEFVYLLPGRGVECVLEWNRGNHFTEPDIRTAKAFAWLLGNGSGYEA